MKLLTWILFYCAIATMAGVGSILLTDVGKHFFDFWSDEKRNRWKRSHKINYHYNPDFYEMESTNNQESYLPHDSEFQDTFDTFNWFTENNDFLTPHEIPATNKKKKTQISYNHGAAPRKEYPGPKGDKKHKPYQDSHQEIQPLPVYFVPHTEKEKIHIVLLKLLLLAFLVPLCLGVSIATVMYVTNVYNQNTGGSVISNPGNSSVTSNSNSSVVVVVNNTNAVNATALATLNNTMTSVNANLTDLLNLVNRLLSLLGGLLG